MENFIKTSVLWPGEKIINQLIESDDHIKDKLSAFSGKSIQIESSSPDFLFTIHFNSKKVSVNGPDSEEEESPDIKVSGETKELLGLLINQHSLSSRAITLKGDIQFAQDLNNTLLSLNIDWFNLFAPILGPVVTNELERFLLKAKTWSSKTAVNLKRNIDEYLREERKLFPHNANLQDFGDSVDQLKLKIDRTKARADLLYLKINELNG